MTVNYLVVTIIKTYKITGPLNVEFVQNGKDSIELKGARGPIIAINP